MPALPSARAGIGRLAGLLAASILLSGVLASSAAAETVNVTGVWQSVFHCTCGTDYPDTYTLKQAKGSSKVTGHDQLGAVVTGTVSGSRLRFTGDLSGYKAMVSVAVSGSTWSGTATDSNGLSGTDTATGNLTGAKRPTEGQMICNRSGDAGPFACTVTIGDADTTGTPTAPTGRVTFEAPGGVFTSGSSCSLSPTPGSPSVSSCTVAYVNPKIGIGVAPPITATYDGDAKHGPTTAQETLFNAVPDLADPPDICLADDGGDLCAGLDVDLRDALSLSDDDTSIDLACYGTDAGSRRRAHARQLGGGMFQNPAFGNLAKPQSQACRIRAQIDAKRQQIKKLEEAEQLAKQVEEDKNAAEVLRRRAAERQRRIDALLHSWNSDASDAPDATAAAAHRSALGLGIAQATIPFHGHKRLRLKVPAKARPYVDALRSAGIRSLRVLVRVSVLRPGDTKVTTATRTVTMELGKP